MKELGANTLDFMVGHAYQDFYTEGVNENKDQTGRFTSDTSRNILFPIDQNTVVSFFGRAKYDYKDKYLLTFTVRHDGSSRLAPKNRWVTYPAAAFAWRISEENFLKSANLFADLKVRLGWGVTGQQDGIGNYDYLSRYTSSGNSAQYQLGNGFITTIRPEGYNADLKWQTTTTYNAGLDMTVFSGRASVSVDYYRRTTEDLLNDVPVPAGSNFINRIISNV
ncbi:MAG: TonB-dependent receptor, partial [Saprospiraceae bacterium]|nr:TonB-dependent receptor [Saprospiraceae bacterium]